MAVAFFIVPPLFLALFLGTLFWNGKLFVQVAVIGWLIWSIVLFNAILHAY